MFYCQKHCIGTVTPSGGLASLRQCCNLVIIVGTVTPSGDRCFTETVPLSSDHYCTKKVAPPSDQFHPKRT